MLLKIYNIWNFVPISTFSDHPCRLAAAGDQGRTKIEMRKLATKLDIGAQFKGACCKKDVSVVKKGLFHVV